MKLIPWAVLTWVCKRFGMCWASLVVLKIYGLRWWIKEHRGDWWSELFPSRICFESHPKPHDYCGLYGTDHPACPKHTGGSVPPVEPKETER